ncbi:hypothetical protein DITRI_Ditri12bG0011500 [Diplodiscus trichospermus]
MIERNQIEEIMSGVAGTFFVIVLLEIISGKKIGIGEVEHGLIAYVHVGLLCVQEDPKERPTISKILVFLHCEDLRHKQPVFPMKSYSAASTSQATDCEITVEEESPFIYDT